MQNKDKILEKQTSLEFKLFIVDLIKTISKISIKLIVTLFIGLIITVIIGNCFGFEMSYDNKLDFYLYVIIGIIEFLVVFSDIWSIFYTKELIKNNPIIKMKTFDEKGVFSKYINKAEKYQTSIELHKEQNNNLKNETIIEKYNEVYEGVNSRLILICNYIKHFDYISEKALNKELKKEIETNFNEIEELIKEMNRLDNLLIKINNNVDDNDITSIKDFIDALEELND